MDNEIVKSSQKANEIASPADFKGYTIEDLRYQRALVALQKDFAKSKLLHKMSRLKGKKTLSGETKGINFGKTSALATKLLSGLNYLDYAMIGLSLFSSGKKVYSFFHKKKK